MSRMFRIRGICSRWSIKKVDIDNVDIGLRKDTPSHQPTYPFALRLTEERLTESQSSLPA